MIHTRETVQEKQRVSLIQKQHDLAHQQQQQVNSKVL
jgi:hypothetical protein